jgi:sugar O-acyltransferase (sialic acid O-acetyltransferase NeuD family)
MNKESSLILIGGGGHCKSCIDIIRSIGKYQIIGILDIPEKIGEQIEGYPIIASDDKIQELANQYDFFFITIGQIRTNIPRVRIYNRLKEISCNLPVIMSSNAYISKFSTISEGSIIMHGCVVNTNVKIGVNCIINTGAVIEHDSTIGNHTHISTGAIVNGNCVIGNNVFVGSNSVVFNNIIIPDNTIIGAGSLIHKSIERSGVYIGNPIRRIHQYPK